jgi:hypothetical protein
MLKRLVFGKLIEMPAELPRPPRIETPTPLQGDRPDQQHKVLYCRATLPA